MTTSDHRIICGALLLTAAFLLSACSKTSPEEHLRSAQESAAKGDIPASVIELKNVLQQDPENVEARWLLAHNYMKLGFGIGAEKELRRIQKQRGTEPAYIVALLQALVSMGAFEDLLAEVERLSADDIPAAGFAAQAEAYIVLENREKAAEALARADALASADPDVLLAKGIFAFAENDSERALEYIKQAQASRPDDLRALIIEGRIRIPRGEFAEAEAAFRKAVKLVPVRADAQAGVVHALLAQNRMKEARAVADKLVRQFPQAPLPLLWRAAAQSMAGENDAARDGLREVLRLEPQNVLGRFLLARTNFTLGALEQAEAMAKSVVQDVPQSFAARRLYASILIKNDRVNDAINFLEAAREQTTQTAEGLEFMGMAYLEAGRVTEAAEFLSAAADLKPGSTELRSNLAFVKIAANDVDSAVEDIAALVDNEANKRKKRVLNLLIDIKKNKHDTVIAEAESLSKDYPDDALLHYILGVAYLGGEDSERAQKEFLAALELDPKMAAAMENLALIAHTQGDTASEIAWLERTLQHDPRRLQSQLALAQAKGKKGDFEAAQAILESTRESSPDAALPMLSLGRMYIARKDFPAALKIANDLSAQFEHNPDILMVRGYAELGTGDDKKALATLTEVALLAPESANAHYALAAALHRSGRIADTRAALHNALSKDENHLDSLRTLAELEAAEGATEQALEVASRIQKAYPDAVDGPVIEGDIRAASGTDDDGAFQAYERAVALGAGSDVIIRQYKLRMRQGRPDDAISTIAKWMEQHPEDGNGQFMLALAYQRAGDIDRAIAGYEQVLKLNYNDVRAMNNLAEIYHKKGDARALDLAEKAYSLHPDDPGVTDTLGWIVLERGDSRRAEDLITKALNGLPGSPTIQYHLAAAMTRNGRTAKAIDYLNAALKVEVFEGRTEAERLLKQVERL